MSPDGEKKQLASTLRQYEGFVFRWQAYKAPSPEWNHDHCKGCWVTFAERPSEWSDAVYTEGWVTLWPVSGTAHEEAALVAKWRAAGRVLVAPRRGGFQLDWLCPECFEACREELGFVIDPEHPQWREAGL